MTDRSIDEDTEGGKSSGKEEDEDCEPDLDINIDDVNIGGEKPKAPDAAGATAGATTAGVAKDSKKKAVTESIERLEPELVESKLCGLLNKDNEKSGAEGTDD